MATLTVDAPDVDPFETDDDETPVGRSSFRDEFQQARDADVKTLVDAWRTAGKPTHEQLTALPDGKPSPEFKAAAKKVYIVTAKERNEVKKTIRRACLMYKPTDDGSGLGGVPVYVRDRKLDDGRWRIKFTWSPQPVKVKTPAETPAAPAETPAETQHDETPGHDATTGQRGRFGRR